MKKTLLSLLTITAITTATWADISTEQLDKYMKASGADVMLENMQKQLSVGIEQRAKMKGETLDPKLVEAMSAVILQNVSKFTDAIKQLDEADYKKIMEFFDSDLGKKTANEMKSIDMVKMQQEMQEFSKKEIVSKRKELLAKLSEANMSEKRKLKMARTMMMVTVDAMPKEMQEEMKKEMDAQLEQMKPMLKKQVKLGTAYSFRNYSNKEIVEMTEYFKTDHAQADIEAVMKGTSEYMRATMPKVMEAVRTFKKKESK